MAAGVFEAIGVISGVLGIIQFGIDNFAAPESVGSTVRIAVGLDYDGGLSNAGGDLPDVRLFNEAGDFIGMVADPGTVDSGGFADITIPHNGGSTQQATYALFSANDNAICIAYAAITWPGGDEYSWIGDWGRQCGGTWYYSNYFISGTDRKPDCMWIDANNDQPQTGFQVHWPEFSKEASGYPEDPSEQAGRIDRLCNAGPPFKMYKHPDTDPKSITYWVLGSRRSEGATATSYGPSKYPVSARFQEDRRYSRSNETYHNGPHFRNLVIDDNAEHTGRELCESPTSLGPDFINIADGTFCRMSDKTLWPVCNGQVLDNCFKTDVKQLIIGGVATRDSPYKNIIDWTSVQ
ncbi:hypothetical protein DL771_010778 [Monosporascus sp. 5C6A]|nr:hypothetical protein DL771_010778 [Monosporascus sp. 5C6A]